MILISYYGLNPICIARLWFAITINAEKMKPYTPNGHKVDFIIN